jgi:hypothetical protein
VECCNKISEASKQLRVQTPSFFVRNADQQNRLRDAAAVVQDKALADFITRGLAWHNAAMSQEDRALVEQLYISRDLMCIAATATLAQVSHHTLLCGHPLILRESGKTTCLEIDTRRAV